MEFEQERKLREVVNRLITVKEIRKKDVSSTGLFFLAVCVSRERS